MILIESQKTHIYLPTEECQVKYSAPDMSKSLINYQGEGLHLHTTVSEKIGHIQASLSSNIENFIYGRVPEL